MSCKFCNPNPKTYGKEPLDYMRLNGSRLEISLKSYGLSAGFRISFCPFCGERLNWTNWERFKTSIMEQLESPEEWIKNNNVCSEECPAWHSCRYDLNHGNERRCMKAFVEWANTEEQ